MGAGKPVREKHMSVGKRPFAALILALAMIFAALTLGGPASAAPYADQTTIGVSDQTPSEGSSFTISGAGFKAGEHVRIVLDNGDFLGTATADSTGQYSFSVTLPSGLTGTHSIIATGETSGKVATSSISISAPTSSSSNGSASGSSSSSGTSSGSGTGLAYTGVAVVGIGSIGLALLVGGGAMLLLGKRRKGVI